MIRQIGTQLGAFCMLVSMPLQAQITSDGTVGTTVNQVGVQFDITGGTQISNNLFHSFGIFDVNTGETASFQGPAGIANILGRVTGGSASNIDGTLQSTISGANLYLINPAGVMFGPNASLDVQGSFHVTTADYVLLGSDGRFDASMPTNTVLTASTPSAFGFVSAAVAPIEFNSSFLRTQDMATLSVIGGDITLTDATLHAMEGRINMASVASAGEVVPLATDLDTSSFSILGDIRITHSTDLRSRPKGGSFVLPLGNIDVSGDGAGDVYIRSGNFISDSGQVYADTQLNGKAGSVDIDVRDELKQTNEARITSDVIFGDASGDVVVDAARVVLESGSVIRTLTLIGSGNAGNVVINARESITASGVSSSTNPRLEGNERSGIGSETKGAGAGGIVDINTTVLMLSDEATLSTVSFNGSGGALTINADSVTLTDSASITTSASREGNAGQLILNADELRLTNGGAIDSRSDGSGDAGDITINVGGLIEIMGVDQSNPDDPQPSLISSNTFSEGNGGSIEINAGRLMMADGGLIQVNIENQPASGQSPVAADTSAGSIAISVDSLEISSGAQVISGNNSIGIGGEISVDVTDNLLITGSADNGQTSGLFSIAVNDGAAGNLQVSAGELQMDTDASINTSSIAAGNAGQIDIDVANLNMNSGAVISSSTSGSGAGGEVRVNASDSITASGSSASGFATGFYSDVEIAPGLTAADASGNGGNIELNAASINLEEGATVSAKSTGTGNAGTVNINAVSSLTLLNGSSVSTAASIAGGGLININARDVIYLGDSEITSSVADGSGNGGDITIDPIFVILDSSRIIARADAGNGGNISITTDYLMASPDSLIDASSNTGIDGEVVIDSPNDNLVASLAELPENLLNAAALLKQRCAARDSGTASSFVVTGPGGVPPQPGGLIYSSVPASYTNLAINEVEKSKPVLLPTSLHGEPVFLLGCSKTSVALM